ncbi:MAG: DegV family protein, partial [Faecalicoccus sp.]|nr:DegV family protein [Faecalicoccus sp.]
MIRLVTDSSALYNSEQAAALGFDMCPLSVTVGEKSWLELDEITTEQLIYKILNEGAI